MGTRPRTKPQHLPRKLVAIRQRLGASQSEMVKLLGNKVTPARLSEYEHGIREPDLFVLLRYAKVGRVRLEVLVDDERELTFPRKLKAQSRQQQRGGKAGGVQKTCEDWNGI